MVRCGKLNPTSGTIKSGVSDTGGVKVRHLVPWAMLGVADTPHTSDRSVDEKNSIATSYAPNGSR